MARYADALSPEEAKEIKQLLDALQGLKPKGWSAVQGLREIVLRPARRDIGKFSITLVPGHQFCIGFFSRKKNFWTHYYYFSVTPLVASEVMAWAVSIAEEEAKAFSEPAGAEWAFTGTAAPVQAEGTIDGVPFYFRSRHHQWTFAVASESQPDPVLVDSPNDEFYRCERFANASSMPLDIARDIITRCITEYRTWSSTSMK